MCSYIARRDVFDGVEEYEMYSCFLWYKSVCIAVTRSANVKVDVKQLSS